MLPVPNISAIYPIIPRENAIYYQKEYYSKLGYLRAKKKGQKPLSSQSASSGGAIKQHSADVSDGLGRIEALWTYIHAVLNTVASEDTEGVVEATQTLLASHIAAVSQEPVGLQQPSRADEAVRVPPE